MLKGPFSGGSGSSQPGYQKILSLDKLKPVLQRADAFVTEAYAKEQLLSAIPGPLEIEQVKVDFTLDEGDSITVGDGLKLEFINAPGHSPCSLAAYLPGEHVMFISDAGGYQAPDGIMSPVFFQDYDLYLDIIKKLSNTPL